MTSCNIVSTNRKAYFKKDLNFISLLQRISGFGVLPFLCSLKNSSNTLSQYSCEKLALCNGKSYLSQTNEASLKSISDVQTSPGSLCQFCINNPITS